MIDDEKNCFLGINGTTHGPMSITDVQNTYVSHKLPDDTLFFREGMSDWIDLLASGFITLSHIKKRDAIAAASSPQQAQPLQSQQTPQQQPVAVASSAPKISFDPQPAISQFTAPQPVTTASANQYKNDKQRDYDWQLKWHRKRGKILILTGIFISVIFFILVFDEYASFIEKFTFFVMSILGIPFIIYGRNHYIAIKEQTNWENNYIPGKKFKFYRKTSEARIAAYKKNRIIFVTSILIVSIFSFLNSDIFFGIFYLVIIISPVLYYTFRINRVKLHEDIDDASYFELEELGIISEYEVVLSLYKDFASWNEIKPGDKILALTQDKLSVIMFSDRSSAKRFCISLKEIKNVGILQLSNKTPGYLLSLRCASGTNVFKILLMGASFFDSPEEFIAFFLRELDDRLLETIKVQLTRETSSAPETINSGLRNIDIVDISAAAFEQTGPARIINFDV